MRSSDDQHGIETALEGYWRRRSVAFQRHIDMPKFLNKVIGTGLGDDMFFNRACGTAGQHGVFSRFVAAPPLSKTVGALSPRPFARRIGHNVLNHPPRQPILGTQIEQNQMLLGRLRTAVHENQNWAERTIEYEETIDDAVVQINALEDQLERAESLAAEREDDLRYLEKT